MLDTFEIIVFEYATACDSEIIFKEEAIDTYIQYCKEYINPLKVQEKHIEITNGAMYIKYRDWSSSKGRMIQMAGLFTNEMLIECKRRLKGLYDNHCESCGIHIPGKLTFCSECFSISR